MTVDSWPRRLMRSSVFLDQPEPDHIVYVYFEKHGPFCGDFFFFKNKRMQIPKTRLLLIRTFKVLKYVIVCIAMNVNIANLDSFHCQHVQTPDV